MAGMSRKEIARIIEHVEPQGVRTTRTKSGILLRFPDDGTAMIHFTSSDHRQRVKVRADLKRHGISFPGDDADALPAYITDGKPLRKSTLQRAGEALAEWEQRMITPVQLQRAIGRREGLPEKFDRGGVPGMNNMTATKALYQLGWVPVGVGRTRKWLRPVELDPEPEWLAPVEEAAPNPIVHLPEPAPQPEPEPEPEPDAEPEPQVQQAGGREFIDTANSWCADLAGFDETTTLAQLRQMMAAVGLSIELRVWRADA